MRTMCGKRTMIKEEDIKKMLEESKIDVKTVFDKTTIVTALLPNGFTITTSASAFDVKNYSEIIGAEICMAKIEDRLWEMEGYLLYNQNKQCRCRGN